MTDFLTDILNGSNGELLMFAAYWGTEIKRSIREAFAKHKKIRTTQVEQGLEWLVSRGLLSYEWFDTFLIRKECFFNIAEYMLSQKPELLKTFHSLCPHRSSKVEFLWALAREMHNGEKDLALKVAGKFEDGEGPFYIAGCKNQEPFDGFVLKFNEEDFSDYINISINQHYQDDCEAHGFFDRIDRLISSYRKKHPSGVNYDYLFSVSACHRFFHNGERIPLPEGIRPAYPLFVARAVEFLYQGDRIASVGCFIDALKQRNKIQSEKNIFFNPIMNFYLILAYKKSDTEQDRTRLRQFLNKKISKSELLYPSIVLARHLGEPDDVKFFEYEVKYLCENRIAVLRNLGGIIAGYYGLPHPGTIPNYAILRHEMSPYLDLDETEKQRLTRIFGGSPLLPSFRKIELWEKMFDDLDSIVDDKEGTGEQVQEKIGYMYIGSDYLEVRIRKILKNGKWGAGKKVNAYDFLYGKIPCMDEIDRQVANANSRYSSGSSVSATRTLPFLIDTDKLFNCDDHNTIEVVAQKPYIDIVQGKEGFTINSNFPKDRLFRDHTTSFTLSHMDRMNVIQINPVQQKILKALFSLPALPPQSAERLRLLLTKMSKHIEIHSDLLEGGSSLETVKGDPTLHIRINPKSNEYQILLCVRPLNGGKLAVFPGKGDKTVYDETDGKRFQVSRKMSAEKQLLNEFSDFLEDELEVSEDLENIIPLEPWQMLSLAEWAEGRKDNIVLEWPGNKKIKISCANPQGISVRGDSSGQWFEMEGDISFDDGDALPLAELLELISSGNIVGRYVKISDDKYLSLTEMLRKQVKRLESVVQPGKGGLRISKFNVGILAEIVRSKQFKAETDASLAELEEKISQARTLVPEIPKELNATLRDYQLEGFRWMARLAHWGAGACLADDMGLGKTVQAITFLLYKASEGPSLVIAPASVILNWAREIARFAPTLRVIVLNSESDREDVLGNLGAKDIVLATYGLLAHDPDAILGKAWNVACLDEAHTIKNRQTKTSASAMQLKASSRIILTGTPVQNYLGELWNLLQFLNPGLLGSYETFSRKFISSSDADLEALKKIVQPFILRRTKAEVLDELPEKTDINRTVQLSDVEMLAYETIRKRVQDDLESEMKVTVNVLAEITRLRQAACSMSLVDKDWKGANSKVDDFVELVSEIVSGGNRVLVFSQFTSFLDIINRVLDQAGISYFHLDGSTPIKEREKMVRSFQSGERNVFTISLKAGGLGLNLTGANYVIHLDPWWNPAIEQQATDRTYRIGQHKNVTVYHLVSAHTIEEKILRLHETKRHLADTFLEGTDKAQTLSIEDLRNLCR